MKDYLSNEELDALKSLSEENFRSEISDEKLIERLKSEELLQNASSVITVQRIWLQVAAAVVLLLGGYTIGFYGHNIIPEKSHRTQYALFLFENGEFEMGDPEAMISEYENWAIKLGEQGKLEYAEKLNDSKELWLGKSTIQNTTSKLTGYFVYYAKDFKEAQEIAKTHPHIKYGGGMELREIDEFEEQ